MSEYTKPVRQLGKDEIVKAGDLVTIGSTPSTGFREILTMSLGSPSSVFSYPIYRYVEEV